MDTYIDWGDVDTVMGRMGEHIDAGASGIALAALPPDSSDPSSAWDLIEAVAPGA